MKKSLFKEFPDVSSREWKQKIQADLRGADYNETLIWESPEGIPIKPFYHPDDFEETPPLLVKLPGSWRIAQVIFAGDAKLANAKALNARERGAESLIFTIPTEDININEVLNKIDPHHTPIHLSFQFLSPEYIASIFEHIPDPENNIRLHIDIIGHLAKSGNWYYDGGEDQSKFLAITAENKGRNIVSADLSLYQNAGANMIQQLAYGMAHANEYLNILNSTTTKKSLPGNAGFTFKVAIGGNYFFEIAKLRALRVLWKSISEIYGIAQDCHILATPGRRNKTVYDFNSNMLRTTMESMSAILGGANTVCNLPYDAFYHKDNEFGERIAGSQLLILKNESHFDKVSNAADGAYYIEKLTLQMAEKALKLFKNIEAGGGFLKQLKDQTIQKKIRESADKEQQLFNDSAEVLVGSNAYKNSSDVMKETIELDPFLMENKRKTLIEPIIERRLAEKMEQDRLKNE